MKKLLYVKANPKCKDSSRTFKISDYFIEEYLKNNPQDEVTTLDLYKENIRFLSEKDIASFFNSKTNNDSLLTYAHQFAEADKYVFAEPLWNLGVPAILKAYFDLVVVKDISFTYSENGPVGLLKNKKALNITTRGGVYSTPEMKDLELGYRYIRTIVGFMGVSDFASICAEGLDMGIDVDKAISDAKEEAFNLAKTF